MVSLSLFVDSSCKPARTNVEGRQGRNVEVELSVLVTQTIILSVEMDIHLSLYSTDFHILLDCMCTCMHFSGTNEQ